MRIKAWLPLLGLACVLGAPLAASAAEADRLREAAEVVRALRTAPDQGIPEELWEDADCVVVIPSMKKAAFVFGGEAVDLVLLVMNRQGVDSLLDNKVSLGVDASVAAGPVGRTGSASTDAALNAQILSYSRSKGLFAGIDLSGGVLRPDKDANEDFYGRPVASRDVLFGPVTTTDLAAPDFVSALGRDVRPTTASGNRALTD